MAPKKLLLRDRRESPGILLMDGEEAREEEVEEIGAEVEEE